MTPPAADAAPPPSGPDPDLRLTSRGRVVVAAIIGVALLMGASLVSEGPVEPVTLGTTIPKPQLEVVAVLNGEATWYGPGVYGNRTASGDLFDPERLTAAHPSLPLGTRVRLTGPFGDSIGVRINDRLPSQPDRRIDLTETAFQRLADLELGRIEVRMEVLLPEGADPLPADFGPES